MEEEFEFEEEEEVKQTSIIRKIFFIIVLIFILLFVYAKYIGNSGLQLKEYKIVNTNILESFNDFKIAHFSDIYYGKNTNIKDVKNVVKKINMTNPDIIIFTGDLTDKITSISEEDVNNLSLELSKLKSNYGKFYVTGDNDIKNESYDKIMGNANFKSLNDTSIFITNKKNESIFLAGINYKSAGEYLNDTLNNILNYKILIMHTPDSYDNISKYNFDLVLAGHSLGGQINVPFINKTLTQENAKKYYKDYYKFENSELYISSGIGTDTMDYRFLNRPSFNLYKLNNK